MRAEGSPSTRDHPEDVERPTKALLLSRTMNTSREFKDFSGRTVARIDEDSGGLDLSALSLGYKRAVELYEFLHEWYGEPS